MSGIKDKYAAQKQAQRLNPQDILAAVIRERDHLRKEAARIASLIKEASQGSAGPAEIDSAFLEVERFKRRLLNASGNLEKIVRGLDDQQVKMHILNTITEVDKIYDTLDTYSAAVSPTKTLKNIRSEILSAPINSNLKMIAVKSVQSLDRLKSLEPNLMEAGAKIIQDELKEKLIEASNGLQRLYVIQAMIAFGRVFRYSPLEILQKNGVLGALRKVNPDMLSESLAQNRIWAFPQGDLLMISPDGKSVNYYLKDKGMAVSVYSTESQFKILPKT